MICSLQKNFQCNDWNKMKMYRCDKVFRISKSHLLTPSMNSHIKYKFEMWKTEEFILATCQSFSEFVSDWPISYVFSLAEESNYLDIQSLWRIIFLLSYQLSVLTGVTYQNTYVCMPVFEAFLWSDIWTGHHYPD